MGVAIFGSWLNLNVKWRLDGAPGSAEAGTDVNQLLHPQGESALSSEAWGSLKSALEGGLHSLFIVMAVFAVLSLLIAFGLRKGVPSLKEEPAALKEV
ncbi:hypothetical protein D3C73_1392910 [compost metagenome]